jgi:putative peptide zinc metalloprotease protein
VSVVSGAAGGGGPQAPAGRPLEGGSATPDGSSEVPVQASGLQLIGQTPGSGYRKPPSLARRADGQMLQLTSLLYRTLEAIDGQRGYDEIAAHVSAGSDRSITAADARMLVESKLRPLGVVRLADGSQPELRRSNPLLALRFRWVVSDPAVTRRITAPFGWLFNPLVVTAVLVAFVGVCKWLLFDRGLALAAHQAFDRPGLLLTVFAITVASAGFHEFGHAAAARYGGATPGAMGAGLYLVWPAFYTDVTDSYRLGRGGRIRTDLGGLYFNALLSVAMFGLWSLTGWDAMLLVIGAQLVQMVRQLPPLVRFDGYHLLADITGVPDLFHRIKPTLLGLLPSHWGDEESKVLKPWARAVVTIWVLLVVPLLLLVALVTVLSLPRILATAAVSFQRQFSAMLERFGAFDLAGGLVKLLAVVAVGLPILGIGYLLVRVVRQLSGAIWRATAGKPGRRALAGLLAAVVLLALIFVWWPRGNYRPIQSYERGTIGQIVPAASHTESAGLREGRQDSAVTLWPADAGPLPSAEKPALSLVLVPRSNTPDGKLAPTWVFPFNRPAAPGPGDNQALAVNTSDGTVVYDVAFALVWADQNTVLNKNEAYAFASCNACKATAISFQVVLILGNANVVVPQNISAAVTYQCVSCVTQALAVQLVLSVSAVPSAAEIADVQALWREIEAFAGQLRGLSFAEIHARLIGYQKRLLDVITQYAPGGAGAVSSSSPGSGSPSAPGVSGSGAPPSGSLPASTAPGESSMSPSGSGLGSPGASESASESASQTGSASESASETVSPPEASTAVPTESAGTPTSTP